jgi:predicted GNAT superfamily acetyltransferase
MELDDKKIDEAVLALLYLTLNRKSHRAWKTLDYDAMDRLYEKGFIVDPVGKAKSVLLTEEGETMAERLAQKLFGKN